MTLVTQHTRKNRSRDSLMKDSRGLSTVEYVIVLALIAVVAIASWRTFGNNVKAKIELGAGEVQGL